jgi:hypothetical protein
VNQNIFLSKGFFFVLIFAFLTSCDVQKRIYRNGYYIGSGHSRSDTKQTPKTLAKDEKKMVIAGNSEVHKSDIVIQSDISPKLIVRDVQNVQRNNNRLLNYQSKRKNPVQTPADTTRPEVDYFELQKVKRRSVFSLVMGVTSLLTIVYFLAALFALIGIILAVSALRKARKIPYPVKKISYAKIGLTLSIIGLVLGIGYIIFYIIATSMMV